MTFDFVRVIVDSNDTRHRVQGIVDEARATPGLVGEDLWESLALSGVAVGVDAAMAYVRSAANTGLTQMRGVLASLTKIASMVDDEDTVKLVLELHKSVKEQLQTFANTAKIAVVAEASRYYEISDSDMIAFVGGTIDSLHLQRVGHRAFRIRPDLFGGWFLLTYLGKSERMKCMCANCVIAAVHKISGEEMKGIPNSDDAMTLGIEQYGGLSGLYEAYGHHLLDMTQRRVEEAQEGAEPEHLEGGAGMTMVSDILKSFSNRKD